MTERYELDDVELATMFGCPAFRHRGKVVCFLDHEERLVVKLSREHAVELVGSGRADSVVIGRRTLREWVAVPREPNEAAALDRWRPHVVTALELARQARES